MHTESENDQKAAHFPASSQAEIQRMRGKRALRTPAANPRPAQRQVGRVAPVKIHSTELDPMSTEIEGQFLNDMEVLTRKVRQIRRAYIQGEAAPYAMPDHPRTVVTVTAKQRLYTVDGKPTLYVNLSKRYTAEEKADLIAANEERRKNKIPGGDKGKRAYSVVREVIVEREV